MGRDEQIEEREVLESIFPEEIKGLRSLRVQWTYSLTMNSDLSDTSYRISIALDVAEHNEDDCVPRT